MNTSSYLELFIGPMFSGKTSKLVELYKQCTFCSIPVLVINHASDTRYDDTLLSTHDQLKIECEQMQTLDDLWTVDTPLSKKYSNAQVVLINEGQFFEDLYGSVVKMLADGKKVYVAGLDGDFQRKKFGAILDLIPLCDKVTKLVSLCSLCKNGTPAIFSKRLTDDKEQTVVGSANYAPVCRACYAS